MIKFQYYLALFLFFYKPIILGAQITFVNPSFEDQPSDATIPKGWMPCEEGTTPDILPGFWGEYGDASNGKTYLGLITRSNGTFESIGQRFSQPLKKGECYSFSIDVAQGKIYSGYSQPIKLRIWLGSKLGAKDQNIYTTDNITNESWKRHVIEFNANGTYQYIRIEAYYKDEKFSWNGNVLLDNLSIIKLCNRA